MSGEDEQALTAFAALERKYRVMAELRLVLPRAGQPPLEETAPEHARVRALAAEFPGALRELDTLPTKEIDGRRAALLAAAAGGAVEPWMRWLVGYHALMRAALALKRRLAAGALSDDALSEIVLASGAAIDRAFADAVAAPPHGRLNVVVFDRLGALHALPPRTIWDALFPPRAGDRAYRDR